MSKVRNAVLLMIVVVLAACGDVPKTIGAKVIIATSTQIEITPVATETPTQIPTSTPRPTLAPEEWKNLPIVPIVSDTARAIYQRGLEMGNNPRAFSKVGDCQTSTDYFLVFFDHPGQYSLGDQYAGLQSTIDYYQGSFSRMGLAVKDGFNIAAIVSPLRADPTLCDEGETPLACELRLNRPSVALISLETNFNAQKAAKYGEYMRQIVEYSISHGVVPILATKADNKEGDHSINAEIARIATEYDIPMWNFWAAVQRLPDRGYGPGLMRDKFHLSIARNDFDDPVSMEHSWPWRNLTALQALDAVQNGLSK